MTISQVGRLVLLALATFLVACASAPGIKDGAGNPIPVPTATFKLAAVDVTWLPNAGYTVRGTVIGRGQKELDTYKKNAQDDMEKRYTLLKTFAAGDLASGLAARGVTAGDRQSIELRPLYGYYDQSGFGSGVVLQVSVIDQATKSSWVYQVKADSGLQWIGAMFATLPDRSYVTSFANDLMKVFSQASLTP
jgi:hypothetical protein